jgi:hypothetical protein
VEIGIWRDESGQIWIGEKEDDRQVMKFHYGQITATPGALILLAANDQSTIPLMIRHLTGDYGDLTEFDVDANNEAIETGDGRVLSAYKIGEDRLWIITDFVNGSQSPLNMTTLLLPEEY